MMWACAMYPAGAAFLQSAAKEVQDNVRRLQAHPSIALWAGNNEDETDTDRNSTSDTPAATEVHPTNLILSIDTPLIKQKLRGICAGCDFFLGV